MGLLDTLANILTREPKARPEYGPMSDALAEQAKGYGVTGGLLNAIDPYILDPMNAPERKWVRQNLAAKSAKDMVAPNAEAMERIGMAGIFAGPNAKTANLVALKEAENLAAKGADNEAIRQATGWFKGMDDKWRFEIPDNAAEFKTRISKSKGFNVPFDEWRGPSGTRGVLGQTLNHDELFSAYPDLANVYVDTPFGVTAQKSPSGQYYQKQTFFPEKIEVNSKLMSDKQKSMEALLHEIEHAVQAREGFTPGGSIRGMTMRDYQNLAGEIEARDVSARMNLTPEQRIATPPDLRSDAIVRYGNGPQMSVPGYVEDAAERKKNFERWFGDSKLLDEDGKPMTLYHGSTRNFDTFIPTERGGKPGFFATDNYLLAEGYGPETTALAEDLSSDGARYKGVNGQSGGVYPLHGKMENPLVVDAEKKKWFMVGMDGHIAKAAQQGNDGVVWKNLRDGHRSSIDLGDVYYFFEPTQVKSATGNRGTYSLSDPNFLKSLVPIAASAYGMSEILPYD